MTPPSRALRTKAGLNHGVQAMPSSVRSCLGWPLPCVFHGHGYSPFVTIVPVIRSSPVARLCYDTPSGEARPFLISIPNKLPRALSYDFYQEKLASFISQITALCNSVPPLLWLMCRNNSKREGTDRHEIHATAR